MWDCGHLRYTRADFEAARPVAMRLLVDTLGPSGDDVQPSTSLILRGFQDADARGPTSLAPASAYPGKSLPRT